jgi:prolyl oligopeptidase
VDADLDPSRYEVRQVGYPSRDGTEVTMFVVHRSGLPRDGANPVYLSGYGGFNISMTPRSPAPSSSGWSGAGSSPSQHPRRREYGEAWHQGGMLGHKQNSFDDFIAAAEWLIRERYTTPERLAAAAGANGGLLMGAVLTQRPSCSAPW